MLSPGSPLQVEGDELKAVLFDSWFDSFRGVIGMVQMRGGTLQKGQSIEFASTGRTHDVAEVGILHPGQLEVEKL